MHVLLLYRGISSLVVVFIVYIQPGGAAIFTTLNRTCLSYALGIQAAEFLGLAPAGAHEWDKFISPEDLSLLLLNVQGMTWSMRMSYISNCATQQTQTTQLRILHLS